MITKQTKIEYFAYLVNFISKERGITESELLAHWDALDNRAVEMIYDSYALFHLGSFQGASWKVSELEQELQTEGYNVPANLKFLQIFETQMNEGVIPDTNPDWKQKYLRPIIDEDD
jgi:hypothetical protein